jgi:hypothetical protein
MTREELFVKLAAAAVSVVAILFVIALINKFAKKRAEQMNVEYSAQLKTQKVKSPSKKKK